jgi:AcrR family transcriptional regulator
VARTRYEVERGQKVDDILEVADRRLRERGYEALSVAAVARELSLAPNAIYWYFPSKDDLFVATLERMLKEISARKPTRSVGEVERILWFTDQFEVLSHLRGAMNERARESQVVAEFVEQLDALLSRMLSNALSDHVSAKELPVAVEVFRATAEGCFVKGLDKRARRKVLRFALKRVMESGPSESS